MNLVIVESPAKARKLSSLLGEKFEITACVGHIRDLPKKSLGVDPDADFEPTYEVVPGKKKVVAQLKQAAKKAGKIFLAMDPDREGEAIAWHVKYLIENGRGKSKSSAEFLRATFHEITKTAVVAALDQPGEIKIELVDAQQARRILDRLVGYKVSPVLWRKVRRGLSAGRVQSPALRLIVERERAIEAFKPEEYWEVDVALQVEAQPPVNIFDPEGKLPDELPGGILVARVIKLDQNKYEPHAEKDVAGVVKGLKSAHYQVTQVERKARRRWSLPPFTTSTLQQQAAYRLGMTSKQTMRLAQQLYEEGLITYHRTDSYTLSGQAIKLARGFIQTQYGANYVPDKPRVFANKSKNAQEAHEAIRATQVKLAPDQIQAQGPKLTRRHVQLYDLIWRRYVASQMAQAVYDQTKITIQATLEKSSAYQQATLKANGSVLKFDGWMKLFPSGTDTILPEVKDSQELYYQDLFAAQKFTQPPARYNDASLVKELEKLGIGRPSTYASIISVLEERAYVERADKKFKPTPVGMTVNDFLVKNFADIVDYDFTAEMEEDLDRIARGEKQWRQVIKVFYQPFAKKVADVLENAKRAKIPVEKLNKSCPLCGKKDGGELVIRTGRYGKFISCSRFPDCDYTDNYEEKLEGVKCPLCQKGDVVIKTTRGGASFYGCHTYPQCDWASWKAPQKGQTITAEEWAQHQAQRAKRQAKRKASRSRKKKSGKAAASKSDKRHKTK